jgi:hypothetical protein
MQIAAFDKPCLRGGAPLASDERLSENKSLCFALLIMEEKELATDPKPTRFDDASEFFRSSFLDPAAAAAAINQFGRVDREGFFD